MAQQLEAGLRPQTLLPDDPTTSYDRSSLKMTHPIPESVKRRTTRSEHVSLGGALRQMLMDHQLGLSINFVLLLGLTHALFPSLRRSVQSFVLLSYPVHAAPGRYTQGTRDGYFVLGWIIYFTGIRVFMLDYVLTPLAGHCGIRKRKARTRFAEQSYLLLYYLVYWTWGVVLFVQDTPAGVRSVNDVLLSLWYGFPRLHLSPSVKLYYLMQMAFWMQQIVVIHLEERRKDHYQMLTHHFVTVGLMVGSYTFRQVRVGNAILVCMDVVDLIFPFAKIMRYLSWQTACDAAFGVFVLAWILARHVGYLAICWSLHAQTGTPNWPYGTYSTITGERLSPDPSTAVLENIFQPVLRPNATTVEYSPQIKGTFMALLLALQCITLVWLVMILRMVVRVLQGHGADDSRSDDEGGEEDEDEEEADEDEKRKKDECDDVDDDDDDVVNHEGETEAEIEERPHPSAHIAAPAELVGKPRFIEVEASSEDVVWPVRKGSGSWKKSKGISSGLNLGDHKDILNRIGCLSEEQLAREREKREDTGSPHRRSGGRR